MAGQRPPRRADDDRDHGEDEQDDCGDGRDDQPNRGSSEDPLPLALPLPDLRHGDPKPASLRTPCPVGPVTKVSQSWASEVSPESLTVAMK